MLGEDGEGAARVLMVSGWKLVVSVKERGWAKIDLKASVEHTYISTRITNV